MNLAHYDWPEMAPGERRRVMLDLAYYLLDQPGQPLDRIELNRALKVHAAKFGITAARAQWLRWAELALNEYADHVRANNPRAIEANRHRCLERHERLSSKLERAFHKLLPDDVLDRASGTEGFADDVKAATMVVRAIVDQDKLRASLYRWADRPPDEMSLDADKAETMRMLSRWISEQSDEDRARIMALADEHLDEPETDMLGLIGLSTDDMH